MSGVCLLRFGVRPVPRISVESVFPAHGADGETVLRGNAQGGNGGGVIAVGDPADGSSGRCAALPTEPGHDVGPGCGILTGIAHSGRGHRGPVPERCRAGRGCSPLRSARQGSSPTTFGGVSRRSMVRGRRWSAGLGQESVMPELPEVETVRLGLVPVLEGRRAGAGRAVPRRPALADTAWVLPAARGTAGDRVAAPRQVPDLGLR